MEKFPKKIFAVIIPIAFIIIFFTIYSEIENTPKIPTTEYSNFPTMTIKLDDIFLEVEIADTNEKRKQGLQFREKLSYEQGMLFDFTESRIISMWMPNMKFSLDMIWFDESGNVVHIEKNVQPCISIDLCEFVNSQGKKSRYVLEVTSGFVEIYDINENSKLYLP